jgi:thiol-disulfide isomerase/thioredoxin
MAQFRSSSLLLLVLSLLSGSGVTAFLSKTTTRTFNVFRRAAYLDFKGEADYSSSSSPHPSPPPQAQKSFRPDEASWLPKVPPEIAAATWLDETAATSSSSARPVPNKSFRPDAAAWLSKVSTTTSTTSTPPPEVAERQELWMSPRTEPDETTNALRGATTTTTTITTTTPAAGQVFSVQEPTDLLHFLGQDDQVCIVKVWTSWCKSCKVLEPKYRKLAKDYGGKARFAEIEYSPLEELCKGLQATKVPHILIYQQMRKQTQFVCLPQDFKKLSSLVEHLVTEQEQQQQQQQEGWNDQCFRPSSSSSSSSSPQNNMQPSNRLLP